MPRKNTRPKAKKLAAEKQRKAEEAKRPRRRIYPSSSGDSHRAMMALGAAMFARE